MEDDDWSVSVFTCKTNDVFEAKTIESEKVFLIDIDTIEQYKLIGNLFWLIELCRDKNINYKIYNTP